MEKVVYLVWRDAGHDVDSFCNDLRTRLPSALGAAGARGLRLNLVDAAVAPAAGLRQAVLDPPPDAVVQVWVDSAIAALRAPIDERIAAHSARHAAYLVTESQPLRNERHRPTLGQRTQGFAQIALLRRPQRLDHAQWLDIWQNQHTRIAIETQSSFEYLQNVVVRPLAAEAPALDAIVEECFPPVAMNDFKAFFDAAGDDEKFQRHLKRMMDSVHRFIDPGTIDVIPTSQYQMF